MVDAIKAYQQSIPANTQRLESGARPDRRESAREDVVESKKANEPDRSAATARKDDVGPSDRERRDLLASLSSERSGSAGRGAAQARGSLLDITA